MIDLDQLENDRRDCESEKAELFDFYYKNWPKVIAELTAARDRLHAIELHHELKK